MPSLQTAPSSPPVAPRALSPLRRRFAREVAAIDIPTGPSATPLVTEEDLLELPLAAQRYLTFMGAVGRHREWSFRVGWTGRFRLGPERAWMPCEAWQYNSCVRVSRLFYMVVRMGGILPTIARDTYVAGHGHMLGKVFDLVTVADGEGAEFDMGELVTYLNDAVFFAPSMLLTAGVRWSTVDDLSFDLSLTDQGHTVAARVLLDERGAPIDFVTEDRFVNDPYTPGHPLVRGRWTTPIAEWTVERGRPLPVSGSAVWHLPGGTFSYAEIEPIPGSLAINVAPGE